MLPIPRVVIAALFHSLLYATLSTSLICSPLYALPPVKAEVAGHQRVPEQQSLQNTRQHGGVPGADIAPGVDAVLPKTATQQTDASSPVKVSPLTARPGETIKMVVTTDKCPSEASPKILLDENSLTIAGSGGDITQTYIPDASDNCTATYAVKIAPKPMNRQLTILIFGHEDNEGKKRVRLGNPFTFLISDAAAIPPGPIPPGLAPQVDVMWNVMSELACRDQFGSRLAKYYFCIDVTLGNNSGYPLILAAVGFQRHLEDKAYYDAAASYLSTRAMVQQSHLISGRNITLRTLQASGALIAGFIPFSGNAGRRGRIGIWSALFGSVLAQSFDAVVPDLTIKNASNLDDAALRDGRLIPNNSPVRFAVFVERDAIKPLLLRSREGMEMDAQRARERATDLKTLMEKESDPAKKAILDAQAKKWEGWARTTMIEARNADVANSGKTGKGNTTKPNKGFGPLKREKAPLEDNLISVRFALGDLIIVGDQIEYLQRVQVDTSAVVPSIEPTPDIFASTPVVQQDRAADIVLIGRGLAKAADIKALKCSPDFTIQLDTAGNSVTLKNFKVKACPESAIPLQINNGSASTLYNLPITPAPQIDDLKKSAVLTKNSETSFTAAFELTGKALTGAKVTIDALNGTKLSPPINGQVSTNPAAGSTSLNFTASIPVASATTGVKATVSVSTPAGGPSNSVDFMLAFPPTLNSTNPNVKAATTMKFSLTGTGLTAATGATVLIQFGGLPNLPVPAAAIKVESVSDTAVTVTLTNIEAAYAVKDAKVEVTIMTGAGKAGTSFVLLSP